MYLQATVLSDSDLLEGAISTQSFKVEVLIPFPLPPRSHQGWFVVHHRLKTAGTASRSGQVLARLDARRVERQRAAPADLGLARVAEARVDEPEAHEPVDVVRGSVREAVEDFPRSKEVAAREKNRSESPRGLEVRGAPDEIFPERGDGGLGIASGFERDGQFPGGGAVLGTRREAVSETFDSVAEVAGRAAAPAEIKEHGDAFGIVRADFRQRRAVGCGGGAGLAEAVLRRAERVVRLPGRVGAGRRPCRAVRRARLCDRRVDEQRGTKTFGAGFARRRRFRVAPARGPSKGWRWRPGARPARRPRRAGGPDRAPSPRLRRARPTIRGSDPK